MSSDFIYTKTEAKEKLENVVLEREALIMSVVSSLTDDLQTLHKHLNTFVGSMPPDSEQAKVSLAYL